MRNENSRDRGKIKGYLFEVIVLQLLRKNNFAEVMSIHESADRVTGPPGFVQFRGRGCWHQIDCPCD